MTLTALEREVVVSAAVLSPDAKQIAVVISRADFVDNRHANSLLLVDVATGPQRVLAPTRYRINSPKWSPSCDRLAWLDAAQGGQSQIHVISLCAAPSAAICITGAVEVSRPTIGAREAIL